MTPPDPVDAVGPRARTASTRTPSPGDRTPPHDAPSSDAPTRRAVRAGIVTGAAYALLGWRSLLVPSLIRSIEGAYGQTDAGMGSYFLATSLGYATGSLAGGTLVRSLGSRVTLGSAALVLGSGMIAQGTAPPWPVFVAAGVLAGVAGSVTDVGTNTLFLDLFPGARGRALNLLHLTWSAAALIAPVAIAVAIGAGAAWNVVLLASGLAWLAVAAGLLASVPSDARHHAHRAGGAVETATDATAALRAPSTVAGARRGLPPPLLVMGLAIGCYVAAEASVSDWLVRVLDDLPVAVASVSLTLFWGGIALGRLVFAKVGGRVEPLRTASVMAAVAAILLVVALTVRVPALSLALFGAVGVAFGPVFPLIFAAAGSRMPGRTATVSTVLTFTAVMGAVIVPPSVGFLSATIGLRAAMFGTVVLAIASAVALQVARRLPAGEDHPPVRASRSG